MPSDDERRILLVEDNEAHAELIEWALNEAGVDIGLDWVCDGERALEYLLGGEARAVGATRPRLCLILLDLRLPKIDGLDVLRQVKAQPHLSSVPVVVLTSSEHDRDLHEAYQAHANSYLVKPLHQADLVQMLGLIDTYWCANNRQPRQRPADEE